MSYVFEPMSVVGLPVHGSDDLYPVRRVYCVGRNYAAHAREMGFDPEREPPFFFCKPNDAESIVPVKAGSSVDLPYPSLTENYHYEIELVVAIGKDGKDIAVEQAAYQAQLAFAEAVHRKQSGTGFNPFVRKAKDYTATTAEAALNTTVTLDNGATSNEFMEELLDERVRELGLTNARWFDMVRLKRTDWMTKQLHGFI